MTHLKRHSDNTPPKGAQLLTVNEAAELLRVSNMTVRRMCARGELVAVKVGSQWRINRESALAPVGIS